MGSRAGQTLARGRQFEEDLLLCDVDLEAAAAARLRDAAHRTASSQMQARGQAGTSMLASIQGTHALQRGLPEREALPPLLSPVEAEVYAALALGLGDYVKKNGFAHVVLGLSGGIDSALVACLAVDALGAENVTGVSMPSPYSSRGSIDDALALARNLGIKCLEIPITNAFAAFKAEFAEIFKGQPENETEENMQPRLRAMTLMALSNKFGHLLLTTGNKSELAVGYCTIYGDMAGGLAVISDVPKTMVYELARWINSDYSARVGRKRDLIPMSIIEKPPSAELKPNQTDRKSVV